MAELQATNEFREERDASQQAHVIYDLLSSDSSPEQKFVGLYLIPKVLSLEDGAGLRQLMEHLPWTFLGQLLKQGTDRLFHIDFKIRFCTREVTIDQMP